jgi:cob(I)alamin adenosyltransferase
MKKSIIYTKTGDGGTTSLVGGKRVPKDDIRIEAYGTTDELNACIGLLLAEEGLGEEISSFLTFIQNVMFTVGAYLANDPEKPLMQQSISGDCIRRIESEIDRMDGILPPLRAFVLPGGCRTGALAHVCRTICRRAEREIYRLHRQSPLEDNVLVFINRLSDYFFVLARWECRKNGEEEIIWNNCCS